MISAKELHDLAYLAKIRVTEEQQAHSAQDLEMMLQYFGCLQKTSFQLEQPNFFSHLLGRKDIAIDLYPNQSQIWKNAVHTKDSYFVVPKILEK